MLKAEGVKDAEILRAEGEAAAVRLEAEAKAFERETIADGEAKAIEAVFAAIHRGNPTPDVIALRYMEALQGVADGRATKLFLPLDATGLAKTLAVASEVLGDQTNGHVPAGREEVGEPTAG